MEACQALAEQGIVYQQATLKDAFEAAELMVEAFRAQASVWNRETDPAFQERFAERVCADCQIAVTDPRQRLFILKDAEQQVIGALIASRTSGHPRMMGLWNMVISPEYRGQGLGTALLRRVLATLQAEGTDWVYLETIQPRFFQRVGFQAWSRHAPEAPDRFRAYIRGMARGVRFMTICLAPDDGI
jgi:N-acetylglutamate synthase-like GNAT family acetyltransferase